MTSCEGLLIIGFGGHARSVADVALAAGVKDLIFIDEHAKPNENFHDFPVLKEWKDPFPEHWGCFAASGNNVKREEQLDFIAKQKWPLATIISSTATIGVGSHIEPGCFIAHHAHIGPNAKIEKGSIINTRATIEHDCSVGRYSHISIAATLAGSSIVGQKCTVFAGATVIDAINICDNVTLAAGTVAVDNIVKPGLYLGVPARFAGS